MARSGKRSAAEYSCLRRFRRRRLLAFLRRDNLPATFDALKHETRVLFDVGFLQRLVVDGRWREARGYLDGFLPCRDDEVSDEADAALGFISQLNVLVDLAHGKLGGIDAAGDLEKQIQAIPPTMADPDYTEAVRSVFSMCQHPAYWDPVDWRRIRLKASQVVKDLVTRAPEFKHLLRLPRCPINLRYTIPFGFGGRWRHRRKNIGRLSASHLARRFLPKERHQPPPWTEESTSEPIGVADLIVETLQAGDLKVREHSDSSSEGNPGSPVGSFIGKSCGISPANAVTKRLSQEGCHAESASSAKVSRITGVLCPDVVDAPYGGMDPTHVLKKMTALGDISDAIVTLVMDTCTYGPARSTLVEKLMEQEMLLFELRVDCVKAKIRGTSIGNVST